jgi:TPR repeat protein
MRKRHETRIGTGDHGGNAGAPTGATGMPFPHLVVFLALCTLLPACSREAPRYQELPAFTPPNVPVFTCANPEKSGSPVNAKAKAWFDQVLALEKMPSSELSEADKANAEQLESQAFEARYWPAVARRINRLPRTEKDGEQAAIRLIEEAMLAGVPQAYFQMGQRYKEGKGVPNDSSRTYAFWQRAGQLGDPQAQVELAKVLSTKQNNTIGWDLVNIPVATAMLECAMANGHGNAAVQLSEIVRRPRGKDGSFSGEATNETRARALAVLQEGVKLGGHEPARSLAVHFAVDVQLRGCALSGERRNYYQFLHRTLEVDGPQRLPNLDTALPLPPGRLPAWRDRAGDMWDLAALPAGTGKDKPHDAIKMAFYGPHPNCD